MIGFVLSLLYALAWSYFIALVFGGWMAGEHPHIGWSLALGGGLIGLLVRIVTTIEIVIANLSQADSSPFAPLFPIITGAVTLGWVLLLAAFAVGLPATQPTATGDSPALTPPGSEAG